MKTILLFLALAFSVPVITPGCASGTLNTSGAYAGNKTLYATDQSLDAAMRVLDVFVKFEMDNRASLPAEVREFANKMRREVPGWSRRILALRDTYAAAPSIANKANLDTVLKLLREAVTQAAAYLVEKPI